MRVESIALAWFRGAADPVALDANARSMVVYGLNASGKSSFVDAVEYVIRKGKIGHLSHEYSGKHQEKGVLNTHRPDDCPCQIRIQLADGSHIELCIGSDGSFTASGSGASVMDAWDYPRTVLRQDEVAEFIKSRKGEKYTALVPLLGLVGLETAAENLRLLAKKIEDVSKLKESKGSLDTLAGKRTEAFGSASTKEIVARLLELHAKHCDGSSPDAPEECRNQVSAALDQLATEHDERYDRYRLLKEVAGMDLAGRVATVRQLNSHLAAGAEPFLSEQLQALDIAARCLEKVVQEDSIDCPACGRSIEVSAFQAHVKHERERLRQLEEAYRKRKTVIAALCDDVKRLRTNLGTTGVVTSCKFLASGSLPANLKRLHELDPEALRDSCDEAALDLVTTQFSPLVDAATECCAEAPPDVVHLEADRRIVEAVDDSFEVDRLSIQIERTEALLGFVRSLEDATRQEIGMRAETAMAEISKDIERMWSILHPDQTIDHVRLYTSEDASKAIDIALKFHGVEQESPRLTLSEGKRNSLGLCIFLAMAKRATDDRPLFLDDVVVSLDRDHRGMIVELLAKEFADRQVVLFTHDRDWYAELRSQLDAKYWQFRALLPFESPQLGIRWSHRTSSFGDARAQLAERPDRAGNDARKIMDVELAAIAERLELRGLVYLRGDRNDRRGAFEFLEQLQNEGKTKFKKKLDGKYGTFEEALAAFDECKKLLATWGNKASHTFDVVRPEAEKLLDRCEEVVGYFKCSDCGKGVWAGDFGKHRQCDCGGLRWG